jgi:hypothetical protein
LYLGSWVKGVNDDGMAKINLGDRCEVITILSRFWYLEMNDTVRD